MAEMDTLQSIVEQLSEMADEYYEKADNDENSPDYAIYHKLADALLNTDSAKWKIKEKHGWS